jgi:hypothetical protein
MQSRIRSFSTVALAFGAIIVATVARGAGPIPIAGQFTCKIVEEHKSKVEGDPVHELIMLEASCDGHASGQSARFDGGQMTMVEADDLITGNGTNGQQAAPRSPRPRRTSLNASTPFLPVCHAA